MKCEIRSIGAACAVASVLLAACSKPAEVAPAGPGAPATTAAAETRTGSMPTAPALTEALTTPAAPALADAHPASGIAWRHASSDADVDAAFRQARAEARPLFLYWGAAWCPPCNQVKATLFNRQDFIERSRSFVPVYVDGDSPGAQKLGARFHVSGYPTMLLFSPDGTEMTRLPGEVDPLRYAEVLTLGMNARRPVKAVLADAIAGGQGLGANDWRLLAFYSWDTDEQQALPKRRLPALLKRLAAACPASEEETATRLWLKALAASDAKAAAGDAAAVERLLRLLGDAVAARAHFDILANNPAELTRAVSARGTPARERLAAAYDRTLVRFEADATVSRADRLGAAIGRVDLAKIDVPKARKPTARLAATRSASLAPALLADVRDQAARADRETTDGYERQAVVPAAAYLLADAGLIDESDALLTAGLGRSHSPYYLMSELADNAAQRGDAAAALRWHREAWERSEGAATRLQWGARYVGALIELAPRDEALIERTATQVLAEAAAQPNALYERGARSLRRLSTQLRDWNKGGAHAGALRRFDARLGAICGRFDPADAQRATCDALLKPEPKTAA